MGKVVSIFSRPARKFNLDKQVAKIFENDDKIARPAPRHPSTKVAFDKFAEEHQEFRNEQNIKHSRLNVFLKSIKVNSFGDNPQINAKVLSFKAQDHWKNEEADYGYPNPGRAMEGRASLRMVLELISKHHIDPNKNSYEKLSQEYRVDLKHVEQVLIHFHMLHMHMSKNVEDKKPRLLWKLETIKHQPDDSSVSETMTDPIKRPG